MLIRIEHHHYFHSGSSDLLNQIINKLNKIIMTNAEIQAKLDNLQSVVDAKQEAIAVKLQELKDEIQALKDAVENNPELLAIAEKIDTITADVQSTNTGEQA